MASNQRIPITFQWTPFPDAISPLTPNQFGQLLALQLAGYITTTVSFFLTGSVDPTSDQQAIFYNTAQKVFKAWDSSLGAYAAVGINWIYGDTKNNYPAVSGGAAADTPSTGWFLLDGRTIATLTSADTLQKSILTTLFGTTLPNQAGYSGPTSYVYVYAGYPVAV